MDSMQKPAAEMLRAVALADAILTRKKCDPNDDPATLARQFKETLKLGALLGEVVHALRRYHLALDKREHGGLAAEHLVDELEAILAMPWHQGEETKRQKDGQILPPPRVVQ